MGFEREVAFICALDCFGLFKNALFGKISIGSVVRHLISYSYIFYFLHTPT